MVTRLGYIIGLFCFLIPIVGVFLKKVFGAEFLIDYWDEAIILLAFPFILHGVLLNFKHKVYFKLSALFFFYLFFSLASAAYNGVTFLQVFFQLLLELKIIFFLFFFTAFNLHTQNDIVIYFERLIKLVLVASIPLIIWQNISAESYHNVFKFGADKAKFLFFNGFELQRAGGVFWFTGQLAIFSAIASIIFCIKSVHEESGNSKKWFLVALFILLMTYQRMEIFATLMILSLIHLDTNTTISKGVKAAVFLCITVFFIVLISPVILFAISEYSLTNIGDSEAARVVFYVKSVSIMINEFPLGSGLGTYGGKAAQIFGADFYENMGFGQFWWYGEGIFLTDTFWPHILGESGVFGLLSLFLFFVYILLYLRNSCKHGQESQKAFYIFLLLLFNSLTAPNYYEIFSMLPAMLYFSFTLKKDNLC